MKQTCVMIAGLLFSLLLTVTGCKGNEQNQNSEPPSLTMEPTSVSTETQTSVLTPASTPTPTSTPTPAPTPIPTPSPTAATSPTPSPMQEPFTIVWISDTQNDSWTKGDGLKSIARYVVDNYITINIQAVLQTGDLVERHDNRKFWQQISDIIGPIRSVVPFYCVSGNHDIGAYFNHKVTYQYYLDYSFCCVTNPEQQLENGKCWYDLRSDLGLLIIGMGWPLNEKDREVFTTWVGDVLDRFKDIPAIMLTHSFLYNGGSLDDDGQYLDKSLLASHPNLRLIVCGHHDGASRWQKTYEDGHTVNVLLVNFQDDRKRSRGYCTLLTFDPFDRSISATTYSPYYDDYNYYNDLEDAKHTRETFRLINAW